jgi:hypothetical protein
MIHKNFKDDYEGRIVISTGKIATIKDNTEWQNKIMGK